MSIALTIDHHTLDHVGTRGQYGLVVGSIAFDSSYPTGGEPLTDAAMEAALLAATPSFAGTVNILQCIVESAVLSSALLNFTWDKSNRKILGYSVTNSVTTTIATVDAEAVTVSANVGTLAKTPVIAVTAVRSTAGDVKAVMALADKDATIATKECAVTLSTAKLTFEAGTDKVTAAVASYAYVSAAGSATSVAEITNTTNLSTLSAVRFMAYVEIVTQ